WAAGRVGAPGPGDRAIPDAGRATCRDRPPRPSVAPQQAAEHAFDEELPARRHLDRRIGRIARQQAVAAGHALQALDGHLAVQPGDHDLAVACLGLLADTDQVTVEDAVVDHRVATHL